MAAVRRSVRAARAATRAVVRTYFGCLFRTEPTAGIAGVAIEPCNPSVARQRFIMAMRIRGMGDMCLVTPPGAQAWTAAYVQRCDPGFFAYPPASQMWHIRL